MKTLLITAVIESFYFLEAIGRSDRFSWPIAISIIIIHPQLFLLLYWKKGYFGLECCYQKPQYQFVNIKNQFVNIKKTIITLFAILI